MSFTIYLVQDFNFSQVCGAIITEDKLQLNDLFVIISRWFSNNSDDESSLTKPMVHWCHTVCGPVGNCGDSCQKDQHTFNSIKWLSSQGASLGGFIIHADEYVNCIQLIGNTEQLDAGMLTTPVLFRLPEVPCCLVDKNFLGSSNTYLNLFSMHLFFVLKIFKTTASQVSVLFQ